MTPSLWWWRRHHLPATATARRQASQSMHSCDGSPQLEAAKVILAPLAIPFLPSASVASVSTSDGIVCVVQHATERAAIAALFALCLFSPALTWPTIVSNVLFSIYFTHVWLCGSSVSVVAPLGLEGAS
ncbi:hypothetical protein TYRP_000390 [Tyrophagus putrescentiae]|nr:hypothetical protein TYRP_000390 [Tyrophagus putrescentiae]